MPVLPRFAAGGGALVRVVNAVSDYAAVADGATVNNTPLTNAIAASVASSTTAKLYLPGGTYVIQQDSVFAWSLDVQASNIEIIGEAGKTVVKHPAGMPNSTVPLLRIDNRTNVTIRNIIFDGNWGNAVTTIATGSDGSAASSGTWNVTSTTGFPSSGTMYLVTPAGTQTITYTGKTSTTFTGCTGGTGTLIRGYKVGYLDAATGINHSTQSDPRNHLIQIRGSQNITIEDCVFRQSYGDFVWMGYSSDNDTLNYSGNIVISRCRGEMSARNGVTIGQKTEGVRVTDCTFTSIYATAFDTEPQGNDQAPRDIKVTRTKCGLWWNPNNGSRTVNSSMSITGSQPLAQGQENMARNYRITDCEFEGSIAISAASDVVLRGNRIVCDFPGACWSPINVDHFADDITIDDNYIYDRSPTNSAHPASINIEYEGSGALNWQPAGVVVKNNRIHALGGNKGIRVNGVGGAANGTSGGVYAQETNTSTSVTSTTLVRTGAGWTTDKWTGWSVRIGSAVGSVISNTSTTLTLTGWYTPTGEKAPTPSSGTYVIFQPTGVVDIDNNTIDCGTDGNTAGLYGIDILADRGGGRVRVRGNKLRNCDTYGIRVVAGTASTPLVYLEIADNVGWDDAATATFSYLVRINDPAYITKFVLRNNAPIGATFPVASLNGLSSATTPKAWLVHDGPAQQWEGYGSPESAVTAPVGSRYFRLDGGASTTSYVKETGSAATGWTAK
jgi:hypothetical protein